MKTIENRNDISILVNKFYAKIRKNELLGPIFTAHIAKDEWAPHLSKLTDFWEMRLFGINNFKGNPSEAHKGVDKSLKHSIDETHFNQWLELWFETIDEMYEGELADRAKAAASKMAKGQLKTIRYHRPGGKPKGPNIYQI